jgi:hypothetical protein
LVLEIARLGCVTEVIPPVVISDSVYVVDLMLRQVSLHEKESDTMRLVLLSLVLQRNIAVRVLAAGDPARPDLGHADSPITKAGIGVVSP